MNPEYPIYIVSKGRWDSRLTHKVLAHMKVPHRLVIEEQEFDDYASVIDEKQLLILDKSYQENYETFDDLGDTKSKGPGPARNFAWEHSISEGHEWHWVMDDNIRHFFRLNRNKKYRVASGTIFKIAEDFVNRYENIDMAGLNYEMFIAKGEKYPPYYVNTRIYSCNLIKNDIPYRWRGRYNEDTDLSLVIMKNGNCTVLFNAFLQNKLVTQAIKGGNTKEFYDSEGTPPKSQMLEDMHPDVAKVVWKYNRWHHWVDYRPFKKNKLIRKSNIKIPNIVNNYGMVLIDDWEKYKKTY